MKDKFITYLFVGYITIFSILHIIIPDLEISSTERRKLATLPSFEFNNEYITKVDKYLLDHFPFRDKLRNIKATYNYEVLNKLDNNGIFIKEDNIYKSNYPTDLKSIDNFFKHLKSMESFLNEDNNKYLIIIPDKNYYLEEEDFLHIDYDYIYEETSELSFINIDLRNILNKDDYYQTDTHWKQENLDKVIKQMSKAMNFDYKKEIYKENTYNNFYGVYYGEAALSGKGERLTYLTNRTIDNVEVSYLENENLDKIYNLEKLNSLDSYEVYLDGASSFIEITNASSKTDRELIIFRDSFASSITPLLVNYYSKITLIDNRYINSKIFNELVEFNNQDVLFMYSTLIVNNSYSLKN